MESEHLDRKSAIRKIRSVEEDSRAYIKHYFSADWHDARLYDLVIDMGEKSVGEAVDVISDNLKHALRSAQG